MNTFALMLLAFPFYLAVKGRLTAYTGLATGSAPPANTSTPGTLPPIQPIGGAGAQ